VRIDPPDDHDLELVESTDDAGVVRAGPAGLRPAAPQAPAGALDLRFQGELWYWRGPAPYHFITVPPDAARAIQAVAAEVTYGWGMIPAQVRIGSSAWETALWPRDGGYVLPIKDAYRKAEALVLGDTVAVRLVIRR
jgi:hypothetical protein